MAGATPGMGDGLTALLVFSPMRGPFCTHPGSPRCRFGLRADLKSFFRDADGHGASPYGRRDPELREWNEVDKIALSDFACTFGNVDEAIGGAKT